MREDNKINAHNMYLCDQVIRVGAIVGLGNPDVTYCVKDVLISHDLSQGQPNIYLSLEGFFPNQFSTMPIIHSEINNLV